MILELRSLLEDEDANSLGDHWRKRGGNGSTAGAGSDDDDVR